MAKHTETIRPLLATNCLSVFDHFVGLALKGLIVSITPENDLFIFYLFFWFSDFSSLLGQYTASLK